MIFHRPIIWYSTLREVVLVPNRQWGGEGLLGCVFGWVDYGCRIKHTDRYATESLRFGLLHRIPSISREIAGADTVDLLPSRTFVPADQQDFFDYAQARSPPPRTDSLRKIDDKGGSVSVNPSPHYLDPPLPRWLVELVWFVRHPSNMTFNDESDISICIMFIYWIHIRASSRKISSGICHGFQVTIRRLTLNYLYFARQHLLCGSA